jgi:photolyase PhrII
MTQADFNTLPPHLSERAQFLNESPPRADGEFVLYWAHHALRAHDNPALEAAAWLALQLDLPLLVYQGLGGRHRYNSDRHHRFILEAARDFSGELSSLGLRLRLFFHLPEDPADPGPLPGLLARSAAAVSELYPVPPFRQWYDRHTRANPDLPWLLIDASCILPMPVSGQAPTRAFQFRKAHQEELKRRVEAGWEPPKQWPVPWTGEVGFEPFDLASPLAEAIARCRIDHSIPAVEDTPGGSEAGYRRWAEFLEGGLDRYHRLRNDAALPQGVSRMSPYLHYGSVSPFRIAGEAAARGGEGAAKFLDELLIWRELSHHFCFRTGQLETLDILPEWARETLLQHEENLREQTFDWETLMRGRTGNPLWDLAQRSLLRRGELHNNVRMTWGKAFSPWTPTAARALKLMIDLNHRLALDGNDPNSYGGLLWCLGQFDRAFPPGPVFGKVRQRSLSRHASRLDMNRYARVVSSPDGRKHQRVVVIGAGMAGLTSARILEDQGHEVTVVDKARGAGGRMSTRREGDHRFDHGAQYFTAHDPRFLRHVYAWRERGLVESWDARIAVLEGAEIREEGGKTDRFVAVPGMNAICAELAAEQADCRYSWTAESLHYEEKEWRVQSTDGESLVADAVVVALPAPQATALLAGSPLEAKLPGVEMRPCWALMVVADRPLLDGYDAAFVNQGALSWLASQRSRPGRPDVHAWVLHACPDWSARHLDTPAEEVRDKMLEAARELPVAQAFEVESAMTHRWLYALADEPLNRQALWFPDQRLVIAGDWCAGSRVEGAFLSGAAAAGRILSVR